MTNAPASRICVVGTTGSGKTTLAREIARRLRIPHIELDALHWESDWTPAQPGRFRARVADAVKGESWVVDGDYSRVRDIVWCRAELVVWLVYWRASILCRTTRRTLQRCVRQEELWKGNRETFRGDFLSRKSIILWVVKTHLRRRREYAALLNGREYPQLAAVRLRSPRSTQARLAEQEEDSLGCSRL